MKRILQTRGVIQGILLTLIFSALLSGCIERREPSYAKAAADLDSSDEGSRDSLVIELTGEDSVTVFDLLRSQHTVDVQASAQGVFVKAIDSIANGERTYWLYSVNDSMGQVSCDKYVTKSGDRIKWYYRKLGE